MTHVTEHEINSEIGITHDSVRVVFCFMIITYAVKYINLYSSDAAV